MKRRWIGVEVEYSNEEGDMIEAIGVRNRFKGFWRVPAPRFFYGRSHHVCRNMFVHYPIPLCYISRLVSYILIKRWYGKF